MNASEPLMKCRKRRDGDRKRKESLAAISSEGACLLAEWSPALRWHDFYTGFYKERGNQPLDVKGAVRVENLYKGLSTNAMRWDGVVSSSEEDSLKELERRGHIFQQPEQNNWRNPGGWQ